MSITSTGISDAERKGLRRFRRVVGYTVEEVAGMLRVNRNVVYDLVAKGEIASVRVGRLLRIPSKPFHEKYGEILSE